MGVDNFTVLEVDREGAPGSGAGVVDLTSGWLDMKVEGRAGIRAYSETDGSETEHSQQVEPGGCEP